MSTLIVVLIIWVVLSVPISLLTGMLLAASNKRQTYSLQESQMDTRTSLALNR